MEGIRTHSATLFDCIDEELKFEIPSTFPLFDRLVEKTKKENYKDQSLAKSELSDLANEISQLDNYHTDIIFVLIRIHSLRNANQNMFDVPYNGIRVDRNVEDKCDIEFDLLKFPSELQHILKNFIKLNKGPKSPKRFSAEPEEKEKPVKSFMRKTFVKLDSRFCLRNISPAALDKEHNMQELLNFSQRSFSFTSNPQKKQITKIEQLGIINEKNNKRVFYKPDSKLSTNNFMCCYCSRIVPRGWKPINIETFIFCSYNCSKKFSKEETHLLDSDIVKQHIKEAGYDWKNITDAFNYLILEQYGGYVENEEYYDVVEQHVSSFHVNL